MIVPQAYLANRHAELASCVVFILHMWYYGDTMRTTAELLEWVDFETKGDRPGDDVLLRALLELAESAERNRQLSRNEAEDDGPLPEAA